jgi:hypothetical protein
MGLKSLQIELKPRSSSPATALPQRGPMLTRACIWRPYVRSPDPGATASAARSSLACASGLDVGVCAARRRSRDQPGRAARHRARGSYVVRRASACTNRRAVSRSRMAGKAPFPRSEDGAIAFRGPRHGWRWQGLSWGCSGCDGASRQPPWFLLERARGQGSPDGHG